MILSETEKMRIEDLRKRRDHGEITLEQYRSIYARIVKSIENGEGGNEGELKLFEDEVLSPLPMNDVSSFFIRSSSRNQSVRRPFGRGNTGVFDNLQMSSAKSYGWLRKGRTPSGHAMMFPRRDFPLLWLVFVLLASVLLTIITVKYYSRPQRFGITSRPVVTLPVGVIKSNYEAIRPLFGDLAVDNCLLGCEKINREGERQLCLRSCKRISFQNYARRIVIAPILPEDDAAKISNQCADREFKGAFGDHQEWLLYLRSLLIANERIAELSTTVNEQAVKQLFLELLANIKRAKNPAGKSKSELEIAQTMVQLVCINANVALSRMAAQKVATSSDRFGFRYYQGLERYLRKEAERIESRLLKNSIVKEIYRGAKHVKR